MKRSPPQKWVVLGGGGRDGSESDDSVDAGVSDEEGGAAEGVGESQVSINHLNGTTPSARQDSERGQARAKRELLMLAYSQHYYA